MPHLSSAAPVVVLLCAALQVHVAVGAVREAHAGARKRPTYLQERDQAERGVHLRHRRHVRDHHGGFHPRRPTRVSGQREGTRRRVEGKPLSQYSTFLTRLVKHTLLWNVERETNLLQHPTFGQRQLKPPFAISHRCGVWCHFRGSSPRSKAVCARFGGLRVRFAFSVYYGTAMLGDVYEHLPVLC